MSDGDFSGGYSGGRMGRGGSVLVAVVMLVIAVAWLFRDGSGQWKFSLAFVGVAVVMLLLGWVVEPALERLARRLPWRRR